MRSFAIFVSTLALAGCNISAEARSGDVAPASGAGNQRSYQVGQFNAVSLGGHHDVTVQVGPSPSVRAEGDSDELDKLEIRMSDGGIHIGQKERNWSFGKSRPLKVFVTVPALAKASIGGSGRMQIDRVQGESFQGSIGGSGNMMIGTLQVRDAGFSIGGSGTIKAAGRAETANLRVAGSGDADISGVEVRTAEIKVAGSGDARVRATEAAKVSIAGSGDVTVTGPAKCTVKKAGSGKLRCGG